MNPIRDFIFSDGQISPEQASASQVMAVTQVSQGLVSGQTTLVKLLDDISVYTLDRKFGQNRRQAYILMERVFRELPPEFLDKKDFEMVFKLFLKTLEADTENAQLILTFLRALQTHFLQAKKSNLIQILVEFFGNNKFNTALYTFDVRNLTYKIILEALTGFPNQLETSEWVLSHEETVLRTLVDQTEGEKDPRNLMLILEIWEVAFDSFSKEALQKTAKLIFDAVCVYFPITFDDVKNKILVNKQYLIESLNSCLSRPALLSHFMDLILEKLEDQNKEEAEEVLKSLGQLFRKSQSESGVPLDFGIISTKLHQKLNFLLFEITDQTIETTAKQAYREFILYSLSNITNQGVVNWRNKEFVERILADFVGQIVKKPNGKNAHAAIDVLLETIQEFPAELLQSTILQLFKPMTNLAEKPSTMFVYLESLQQILTKCSFHWEFQKIKIESAEFAGIIELLTRVFESTNDSAIRETILKTICFGRRVIHCPPKAIPSLSSPQEVLYWKTFEAVSANNDAFLLENDQEQKRKFEIIITNNLPTTPTNLYNLYLQSLIQILEKQASLRTAQMEEYLRLGGVMQKKLKIQSQQIFVDVNKINTILNLLESAEVRPQAIDEQIKKLFEASIYESILLPFQNNETLFLTMVNPLTRTNSALLLAILETDWFKFDEQYFAHQLKSLSPADSRTWKIYCKLIQKNKFSLTDDLHKQIFEAKYQTADLGPFFSILLASNFQKYSQFLTNFLSSLIAESRSDLASKLISSISEFQHPENSKPKSPLFRQKLGAFLDKQVDTHLSASKFDFISAKLSLINFQIAAGIADQSKAQELNQQFLDFAIESKNNFNVNVKYLSLLEHLVKQESIQTASLISEKLLGHFDQNTRDSSTLEGLSLLCHYVKFLRVMLGKAKLSLRADLRRKIIVFLRQSLRHPKRIVRKLAANAINTAEISAYEE